jgi:hypothetical protein
VFQDCSEFLKCRPYDTCVIGPRLHLAGNRSPTQRPPPCLQSVAAVSLGIGGLIIWQTACTVRKQEKAMSRKTTTKEQIETYRSPSKRKLFQILTVHQLGPPTVMIMCSSLPPNR